MPVSRYQGARPTWGFSIICPDLAVVVAVVAVTDRGERAMTVLTPTDVQNIAFRRPPLGTRGYDEEEVDGFLDRVEVSLSVLYQELGRLRAELDAARSTVTTATMVSGTTVSGNAVSGAMVSGGSGWAGTPLRQPSAAYPALSSAPHGGEPSPDTAFRAEVDLIKRRLSWIEQVVGAVMGQHPHAAPSHTI